ncbi:MAG: hypothetical protein M0036_09705 [Desulfobacteraceae bacterium]|nr:hypothetical protein [Desulfobacteraceae bacterium]
MRFPAILCILLLIWPTIGRADPAKEFIEELPTGQINWSKGLLIAKGLGAPIGNTSQAASNSNQLTQLAHHKAVSNLMETLKGLRLDASHNVAQVLASNEPFQAKLTQMTAGAQIIHETRLADGSVEVTVQMPLLGGFLQMMLPDEIRQVEPIKPVNAKGSVTQPSWDSPLSEATPKREGIYSGLVVDARGIGAKPAMVSLIVDEGGKEVYGSAFISREYAVQYGVCEYVRAMPDPGLNPRVAPKPLAARGLRILPERSCDIVISNTDAAKLRDASANLGFLKQCRVVIIID